MLYKAIYKERTLFCSLFLSPNPHTHDAVRTRQLHFLNRRLSCTANNLFSLLWTTWWGHIHTTDNHITMFYSSFFLLYCFLYKYVWNLCICWFYLFWKCYLPNVISIDLIITSGRLQCDLNTLPSQDESIRQNNKTCNKIQHMWSTLQVITTITTKENQFHLSHERPPW